MRTQFTFYKSFDDAIEDMTDKQIADYIKAILDVQFLRVRIEDVSFTDKILKMAWKSQKHSISTSIKGYLDSQKRENIKSPYMGVYDDSCTPYEGGNDGAYEGGSQQVKEKEQVQEEEQEEYTARDALPDKPFSFLLTKAFSYDALSAKYKEKLKGYSVVKDGAYQLRAFIDHHAGKGSRFKDWSRAYNTWVRQSVEFSKGQYSPDVYCKPLPVHEVHGLLFAEYGTNNAYSEDYDYKCEFKARERKMEQPEHNAPPDGNVSALVESLAKKKQPTDSATR